MNADPNDDAALVSRYQELVSHSSDVISIIDEAGEIEYQSPSAERVLGYGSDELVGESVLSYIHPDDRDRIEMEIAAAASVPDGTVSEAEYRFEHADGSWIWLASVATPRPGGAGFIVNSRDVTDRRETEAALESEHELYRSVVENVNDAIAISRDGIIVFANAQCHDFFGYDPGELIGIPREELVDPVDREKVAQWGTQRLDPERPDPPTRYEVRFRREDGERLIGEVGVEPINFEGDPATLVAIRDVTDRARYEATLETRNEQLEALNRVVRHDIRNDMAVILGWAELLEEHVDEPGRAQLEKVLTSGRHVVELTDIARDFVETLTSDAEPKLQAVPLRGTLGIEIDLARDFYPSATLAVDGDIPDVHVQATEMLSSVFGNLLRNAVQHNPAPAPSVTVSGAVDDDSVVVRVADDGPGVPDAAKDRIFGKGEKGLDSEGTGIGLYLVRTLVEQFGGEVHVEDNEPEGAVFEVRLPLAN